MSRKSRFLLLAASCLFCVLATEAFFYFLAKQQRTYPAVWYHTGEEHTRLLCYDSEFLGVADWDLRLEQPYPELAYAANTDGDPSLAGLDPLRVPHAIEVRVNGAGFRERPLQHFTSTRGSRTTLVLGDSFGAGQGVRVRDRLTELLETRLRAGGSDHQLANFCMMGFNIRSVSRTLNRYMDDFPGLERVVYLFTLNDPVGDRRALEMYQEIDDLMHLRTNLLSRRVDDFLVGRSHAAQWVGARIARKQISARTVERYNYLFGDNAGWKQTKDLLERMKRRCDRRGCEFVIVLFPLLYELAEYPFAAAHAAVREFAQEADIRFVDLLERFEGEDETGYWVHPRDFHPNHRAHRAAAEHLYDAIDWE